MTGTTISLLTPPGKAAIASLAVQGQPVWTALQSLFHRPGNKPLPAPKAGQLFYGRLGPILSLADEVVLVVKAVHPLPRVEIHCHGGTEVVNFLLELFQGKGFQVRPWTELEKEAGAPRVSLLEKLVQAPTSRTARILLDQFLGATDRFLTQREEFLRQGKDEAAALLVERFQKWERLGGHLVQPWVVVVAGAPNVGKSSLVNAIAGFERSIVSPIPGTTRDIVSATLAIDGWPVELLDTAGLRDAGDELEEAGMRRAREAAAGADLILWLTDIAAAPGPIPPFPTPVIPILNKIDLTEGRKLAWGEGMMPLSAKTGEGLKELLEKISLTLVPEVPEPGEAVPVNGECYKF